MQSTVDLRILKTTTKFPDETTKEMREKLPRAITNSRYYVIADNSRGRQKIGGVKRNFVLFFLEIILKSPGYKL